MIKTCRVGFWGKEDYQQPTHYPLDWGVKPVLECLDVKEEDSELEPGTKPVKCCLCGKSIGNGIYTLDDATQRYIWVWPEGFKHYIRKHHVIPDYLFLCFLFGKKPIPSYSYTPPKKRFFFVLRKARHGSRKQT